jgi:hypothetical protein
MEEPVVDENDGVALHAGEDVSRVSSCGSMRTRTRPVRYAIGNATSTAPGVSTTTIASMALAPHPEVELLPSCGGRRSRANRSVCVGP